MGVPLYTHFAHPQHVHPYKGQAHLHDFEDLIVPVGLPWLGICHLAPAGADGGIDGLLDLCQLLLPLIALAQQADVGQLDHLL